MIQGLVKDTKLDSVLDLEVLMEAEVAMELLKSKTAIGRIDAPE